MYHINPRNKGSWEHSKNTGPWELKGLENIGLTWLLPSSLKSPRKTWRNAGNDCKPCYSQWGLCRCCRSSSFIRTKQHHLFKRRAKNSTEGFSRTSCFHFSTDPLWSEFNHRCTPWGSDMQLVSPLAPMGSAIGPLEWDRQKHFLWVLHQIWICEISLKDLGNIPSTVPSFSSSTFSGGSAEDFMLPPLFKKKEPTSSFMICCKSRPTALTDAVKPYLLITAAF